MAVYHGLGSVPSSLSSLSERTIASAETNGTSYESPITQLLWCYALVPPAQKIFGLSYQKLVVFFTNIQNYHKLGQTWTSKKGQVSYGKIALDIKVGEWGGNPPFEYSPFYYY